MGKLIVFEGTDGCGKSTQFRLLTERLAREMVDFHKLCFPQYSEPSSALIRMYLGGEFGEDPDDVNGYAASLFYAVDRYASYVKVWRKIYEAGGLILSDRYTTSNAVHQAAKVPEGERESFLDWLGDLEYGKLGLPRPDLVICLDMPVSLTHRLMHSREKKTHTDADIHERDAAYLEKCHTMAMTAAAYCGWTVVPCHKDGKPRPVDEIAEEIYGLVRRCLEE